ncbi:MAG: hypothetical protein MN733_05080 [Nitrososphaera sp.]|nr:hypothetical protein [Nitrososphaera sp.]
MDDTEDLPIEGGDSAETEVETDTESLESTEDTSDTNVEASEEADVEAPKPSRAQQRIQQEIAKRRALEDELSTYRRAVLENQQAQQRAQAQYAAPQVDPEAERNYLDQLDEAGRVNYLVHKATSGQNAQLQQLQLMMYVQQDKFSFDGVLASNPVLRKYAGPVEDKFAEAMQKGQPRSREEILDTMIGAEIRKKGASAINKAKKTGEENIRRQQTRPYSVRSGVPRTSEDRNESAEARLKRRLAEGAYRNF